MKKLFFALAALSLLGTVIPAKAACPPGTKYKCYHPTASSSAAASSDLRARLVRALSFSVGERFAPTFGW